MVNYNDRIVIIHHILGKKTYYQGDTYLSGICYWVDGK